MDPGVRSHGMKADPSEYLWSKYECFLMSGWWDILHSSCLQVKLWSYSTNRTEVRTNERMNIRTERQKLYTPRHKCRGYKKKRQRGSFWNWYKMMGIIIALQCCQNLYQMVVCPCPGAFSNDDSGLTLTIFMTESSLFLMFLYGW